MKQEISGYYKEKGYDVVYVNTNKEPRRVATLRKKGGEMTSMSYANSTHTIRNDRGVLKVPDCVNTQLFKEYYDALHHGVASQFGIWRSKK